MSRVFWALVLGLALAGPPLQWVAASSDTDHGSQWDPDGQPGADHGGQWDPNGQPAADAAGDPETDHGSRWDPNG